ncbi:MAG: crotonobetainyl-CoA:carnitine CoA-transferase CaiB-like acyl-CoA transferase [Parasphingorhabdus sp.]|jgi:crotonobetainyl-CoA:carnitine CoA-transferase CaiB-like acyl-CoA transferase
MKLLDGIKVAEFCEIAAGPFCAMLLADYGADVIKIERPSGDAMRSWPPVNEGYSENFASVNRNKKSVVLDMKTEQGLKAARAIILDSDVVVENFRPGVMQKLGIDYATMSKQKPELIYCSISAFGQEGPRSREGGFDLTMQAMAGIMSVTGEPGGAPVKCGVPLCDFTAALYGAFSISAAIRHKEQTGEGQNIDVSMLGTSLAIAALQTSEYFGTGNNPRKLGSAHPRNAPYQAFQAADGYFGMAAGNNNLWYLVCDVVTLSELKDDERYLNPSLRAQHQDTLRATLEEVFQHQSVDYWLQAFAQAGVPCSPINNYSDALDDPQVEHMGWVENLTLANGIETKTFGSPIRLNGESPSITKRPPLLGEHTEQVLAELDKLG